MITVVIDAVIITDCSVRRVQKTGLSYTVRVNDLVVAEGLGVVEITTSSIQMKIRPSQRLCNGFVRRNAWKKVMCWKEGVTCEIV